MKPVRVQGGVATRTANKLKRKQTILNTARDIIASGGYASFTLAELANQANVTVPTIHNLIGNKSEVLKQLVVDMVDRTEQVLFSSVFNDPISAVESFTDNLMSLYQDDEAFYKAAFVIGEQESMFEHGHAGGIFKKSLKLAYQVCIDAKEHGFLIGNINSELLADRLFANQRIARYDWMHGYIDLAEYRRQMICGMLLTFTADATEEYRPVLVAKISEVFAQSSVQR
ncbi:TetR/AcrR family transcriptional regulator [Alteromonas sp. M12]|uniref:TetR/AcrR family transcriptional regulator n=1 Tax=Alteromonas sp. M12 TaxID=3135644 RepID=UPI00319E56CF